MTRAQLQEKANRFHEAAELILQDIDWKYSAEGEDFWCTAYEAISNHASALELKANEILQNLSKENE